MQEQAPGSEPAPADFALVHAVDVRFRDIDAMGHAHHSLPLVYWEEARARYWRDVAGRRDTGDIDEGTARHVVHKRTQESGDKERRQPIGRCRLHLG